MMFIISLLYTMAWETQIIKFTLLIHTNKRFMRNKYRNLILFTFMGIVLLCFATWLLASIPKPIQEMQKSMPLTCDSEMFTYTWAFFGFILLVDIWGWFRNKDNRDKKREFHVKRGTYFIKNKLNKTDAEWIMGTPGLKEPEKSIMIDNNIIMFSPFRFPVDNHADLCLSCTLNESSNGVNMYMCDHVAYSCISIRQFLWNAFCLFAALHLIAVPWIIFMTDYINFDYATKCGLFSIPMFFMGAYIGITMAKGVKSASGWVFRILGIICFIMWFATVFGFLR